MCVCTCVYTGGYLLTGHDPTLYLSGRTAAALHVWPGRRCVYVCVYTREKESEGQFVGCVCVCVYETERARRLDCRCVCVCLCVCIRERERETERERTIKRVCASECAVI